MNKAVEDYLAVKAYKREQRKKAIDALISRLPVKPSTVAKLLVFMIAVAFGLWFTSIIVEYNAKMRRQLAASAAANAKWQAREKLELAELSQGPAWVLWMQDAESRKRSKLAGVRTPSQVWCDFQIEKALRETRGLTPKPLWKPQVGLEKQPWCKDLVLNAVWSIAPQIEVTAPSLAKELEDEASGVMDE